ncbi:hypothetical protein CEXT_1061 [Caerostris extrusa]|uniref:Uncharacterized protein n=1 Tax=Caerostris extrusa TaxID=172846 RepID=A0AAV4MX78_CAEEX|nr:hypothetical protein CEXT_1061 [Caerostris extrusa]
MSFFVFHKRWAVLKSHLKSHSKVLKYLLDTRWEAHAKVAEAILENYNDSIDSLNYFPSDNNIKSDTRLRANNLLEKMLELEFVFILHYILLSSCAVWYKSLLDILRGIKGRF